MPPPPASAVPRFHALTFRRLKTPHPLTSGCMCSCVPHVSAAAVPPLAAAARGAMVASLRAALACDDDAATQVLMCIMSNIQDRVSGEAIGSYTLNLRLPGVCVCVSLRVCDVCVCLCVIVCTSVCLCVFEYSLNLRLPAASPVGPARGGYAFFSITHFFASVYVRRTCCCCITHSLAFLPSNRLHQFPLRRRHCWLRWQQPRC
jgi:hypothetical protein